MEKGTLHELQVKKKKQKKIFCYISLVVLIILLFIPPMFRLLIRDIVAENKKKNMYISLNCNKENESITATFIDGVPQNLMYKIKGNYMGRINQSNPDEIDLSTGMPVDSSNENSVSNDFVNPTPTSNPNDNQSSFNENLTVFEVFYKFGNFSYDEEADESIMKIPFDYITSNASYATVFGTVNGQETFYTSKGFSCTEVPF